MATLLPADDLSVHLATLNRLFASSLATSRSAADVPRSLLASLARASPFAANSSAAYISRKDFLPFLRSSELHHTPLLNLLVVASLRGRSFPSTAHLLRGFSYPSGAGVRTVRVFDRKKKVMFDEVVPVFFNFLLNYVFFANYGNI